MRESVRVPNERERRTIAMRESVRVHNYNEREGTNAQ